MEQDGEKPWDRTKDFLRYDVDGEFQITLADGIYVFAENLKPRIQNRIWELAAFCNPGFYKNLTISAYLFLDQKRELFLEKMNGNN